MMEGMQEIAGGGGLAGRAAAAAVLVGGGMRMEKMVPVGSGISKGSPQSEKLDMSPENSEKRDVSTATASSESPDVELFIPSRQLGGVKENQNNNVQYVDNKNMSKSCSMQEMGDAKKTEQQEAEDVKKTLVFTIDFGTGRDINTQRHKSILDRFEQQRHKRGQSLSKLEENDRRASPSPVTPNKPPLSGKLPRKKLPTASDSSFSSEQDDKVHVRLRDRSTSQLRDGSKRHSWSPRSSMHEAVVKGISSKFVPKSSVLAGAMDGKSYPSLDSSSNDPKSLDSFLCPEPPLENYKNDDDVGSDTGTYTVEGDNYTEEQKDKMNIDKLGVIYEPVSPKPTRPTHFEEDLEIIELDRPNPSPQRKNVLEISCCHETSTAKPKVSYLDKLKSRVRNIAGDKARKSPDKTLPSPDVGTFTSVTVSGILSSKPTLDDYVALKRRNSLTKAKVDNSEYVQGISKVHAIVDTSTNPSDSPKTSTDDESPGMDQSTTALKTASTKKDWIQEWARNAREYSSKQTVSAMTRSYDCEKARHMADSRKFNNISDFEYSSDPNLRYKEYQNIRKQQQLNYDYGAALLSPAKTPKNVMLYGAEDTEPGYFLNKPPPSPSKIPSPIHTMARPRSSSRNPSVHGSMTNLDDDTELHLQNTAAAITALTNLHRRNSLRNSLHNSPKNSMSPVHRISPKTSPVHSLQSPIHLTDDDETFSSPRHHHRLPQQQHRRNGSTGPDDRFYHQLMATSATSDNLALDYRRHQLQQQHIRRPSADFKQTNEFRHGYGGCGGGDADDDDEGCADNIVIVEKGRIVTGRAKAPQRVTATRNEKISAPTSSPIKRSSSFSVKAKQQPPAAVLMTPKMPAKRNNAIQKSASSTSFRKLLHYDEDDIEFYVNDDDALDPDDYTSSDDDEDDEDKEPITNTRYNKAFLMRVEQSKKAIAGVKVHNTPEMSRREMNMRRDRASMPRDASLNRLKQDINGSLSNAKKQFNNAPTKELMPSKDANKPQQQQQKVLPKYLDISKYKAPQGASFLKKDESKSYLLSSSVKCEPAATAVKRSPSSASVVMTRSDPSRASTRSVKSAGAKPGFSKKIDPIAAAQKAKEQELEMWKRRAKYDPMKAAAEGKRKQEEARKQLHQQSKSNESTVLRSQSFHSGVGNNTGSINLRGAGDIRNNRWTLTSTESSDIDDDITTTS